MKAKTCDIFVTMNWQERTKTKINGEHDDHEPSKINDCGIYKHAKSGRKRFPKQLLIFILHCKWRIVYAD